MQNLEGIGMASESEGGEATWRKSHDEYVVKNEIHKKRNE